MEGQEEYIRESVADDGWVGRDVATDEGCVKIVEESIKALGGLDVIISNAVCIISSSGAAG